MQTIQNHENDLCPRGPARALIEQALDELEAEAREAQR